MAENKSDDGGEIVSNTNAKTPVWKNFVFPGNGEGAPTTKGKIVCRLCRKEMPYKNNTTNLYVHLERHHKEYAKLRPAMSPAVNSETHNKATSEASMKQSTMTERLC